MAGSVTEPVVKFVNVNAGFALLDTPEVVWLTNFLDKDGEEIADRKAAAKVVGPLADGRWIAINLSAMQEAQLN